MKTILFLIFIFVIQAQLKAQLNYQERAIYYKESDNVCKSGWPSDSINITIIIDQNFVFNKLQQTSTDCNTWVPYYFMQLQPSIGWGTLVKNGEIDMGVLRFDDQATWLHRLGELILVKVKTTVRSPVTFYNGSIYDCSIIGDGIVHHFSGVPVVVKCSLSVNKHLMSE